MRILIFLISIFLSVLGVSQNRLLLVRDANGSTGSLITEEALITQWNNVIGKPDAANRIWYGAGLQSNNLTFNGNLFYAGGLESRFGGSATAFISLYDNIARVGYIQANGGLDLRIGSDNDPIAFYIGNSEVLRVAVGTTTINNGVIVYGTGSFTGVVSAADATEEFHAVNRRFADIRYLGISATAANSTLFNSQNAAYYLNYNNLSNKPTALSQFTNDLLLNTIYAQLNANNTLTGNNYFSKAIVGGIGANQLGGTLDWNHVSNARSGSGETLLTEFATGGSGLGSGYYHPFSFELISKDGTGNITQLAVPYIVDDADGTIFLRNRQSGTWGGWRKLVTQGFADNRYLGISAKAANSTLLQGKDTTQIAQRDAVNVFTQKNTFQKSPVVPDPVGDYDAANYSTVYNTVLQNVTTLSDTINFYPNRPTFTPTQTQTGVVYVVGKSGTLTNLNQDIQLLAPIGAFQQSINLKIINGTPLPSGFQITIKAPSTYTFVGNISSTEYVLQIDPTSSIPDKDQDVSNFTNFRIECTTEVKSKKCDCITTQRQ
jgi:hypothetical protein